MLSFKSRESDQIYKTFFKNNFPFYSMSDTKIESQPIEKTFEKQPEMDKVHRDKSSTSATDKEETTKKSGTSIWAARDPWSKPETAKDPWDKPGAKPSKTKKVSNSSAKNEKDKKPLNEQTRKPQNDNMRYQPKLMLEEDLEKKTVLIKIGGRTSIRQII
jgi:hypothetical protein